VQNYLNENACHLYVHSLEIQVISCTMFCTSICSQKEANSNFEVKLKSAYEPGGPSGQHLSRFL